MNNNLKVTRKIILIFGMVFLLGSLSAVTWTTPSDVFNNFDWGSDVSYSTYGGIDFTYGSGDQLIGYIKPKTNSEYNTTLLFGASSTSGISDILALDGVNARVGINTITPTATLEINGTLNVTGTAYIGNLVFSSDNITANNILSKDGNISFYNSFGSEKVRITSSGKVGIGTTSPGYKLEVNGTLQLTEDNNKLFFGTAEDVSQTMDGTNFNITNEVGSIPFNIIGFLKTTFFGDVEVDGSINQTNGNFTGNQIYGGMFYHNHTGTELNFAVQDTWYPLYFTDATDLNGFSYVGGFDTSSNLTAQVSGKYQASYMGIGSGQNNHIYLTTILIDGVEKPECGNHHKMAAGGDVLTQSGVCIITITAGQTIQLATQDMGSTGTGDYYGGNLNLVRIGN